MSLSPQSTNLAELARWSCETYAEVVAIRDGDTSLTYAELGEVTRKAAAAMIASGVGPGDVVAIWAPNCWQWLVASMGISRAGAVVLPVNTRFKGAEAAHVLNTAKARIVFIVDGFLHTDYSGMLAAQELPTVQQVIDLSTSAFADFLAAGDEALRLEAELVRRRAAERWLDDPISHGYAHRVDAESADVARARLCL